MDYFAQSPITYSPPHLSKSWNSTRSSHRHHQPSSSKSTTTLTREEEGEEEEEEEEEEERFIQVLMERRRHRHSHSVEKAIVECRELSRQVLGLGKRNRKRKINAVKDQGIIKNLESAGWTHLATKEGIRMFSKENNQNQATTSVERGSKIDLKRKTSLGVRQDESLPYFRGEGWIEGSWRLDDVYASIVSIGARAVWDFRMDISDSYVAAYLSETDQLWKDHIKAELGAHREASLISSFLVDPSSPNTAYIISTSVEDSIVLESCSRTKIHLNGVCLRALNRPPHFEQPPESKSDEPTPQPVVRPGHRRTKSSAVLSPSGGAMLSPGIERNIPLPTSDGLQPRGPFFSGGGGGGGGGASLAPPGTSAQTPLSIPRTRSNSLDSTSHADSDARAPLMINGANPLVNGSSATTAPVKELSSSTSHPFIPSFTSSSTKKIITTEQSNDKPGLHVSLILHAAPGLNLPQTTVNQLSLHLPLTINALGRYIGSNGFAPHLVRTKGLQVLEEHFDNSAGSYRVVYQLIEQGEKDSTRIRFYGSTFGKGRFDIELSSPSIEIPQYEIEYDVPPVVAPETRRSSEERKSILSILSSPLTESESMEYTDPARLPGPFGGSTLIIPADHVSLYLPIQITINKNSSSLANASTSTMTPNRAKISLMKSQVQEEGWDSIEEMLLAAVVGTREWAERNLKSAKRVLQVVEDGKANGNKSSCESLKEVGLGLRFAENSTTRT